MPAFVNAGALDNPIAVEPEALEKVIVGDDGVGNVAASSEYPHTRQRSTWRARRSSVLVETICHAGSAASVLRLTTGYRCYEFLAMPNEIWLNYCNFGGTALTKPPSVSYHGRSVIALTMC